MIGRQRLAAELPGDLRGCQTAGLKPAVGRHFPVAGVDPQDQPPGKLPAHVAKPIGLPDGQRADHQAAKAQVEQFANRLLVANAPAQLTGDVYGLEDRGHDRLVPRLAVAGAVEIDEVEATGPPIGPALRHGDSILAKNRLAIIVALLEAYAFTPTQVDCRPDFHPFKLPIKPRGYVTNLLFYTNTGLTQGVEHGSGPNVAWAGQDRLESRIGRVERVPPSRWPVPLANSRWDWLHSARDSLHSAHPTSRPPYLPACSPKVAKFLKNLRPSDWLFSG